MKTERVTLLTTPEFKHFLAREAKRENVSVAELVRKRCEGRPSPEDATLVALTMELRVAITRASNAADKGIAAAERALKVLASRRRGETRRKVSA